MPKIEQHHTIDISVTKFLDNCTPTELMEVDLLIQSNRYRSKMGVTQTVEGIIDPVAIIQSAKSKAFCIAHNIQRACVLCGTNISGQSLATNLCISCFTGKK